MKTAFQPSIHQQRLLGGNGYVRRETQFGSSVIPSSAGIWIASEPKIRTHFAPVASEELMENRRQVALSPQSRRKRILPLIHSSGPTITQADIDDTVYATLRSELESIMLDCHRPGWDGYGAEGVSIEAYHAAEHFIRSLPVGIARPELAADSDGFVTFEWRKAPRRTLLVSIRPGDTLDYAALIGTAKAHGSEPFSDELSETLETLVRRVMVT